MQCPRSPLSLKGAAAQFFRKGKLFCTYKRDFVNAMPALAPFPKGRHRTIYSRRVNYFVLILIR